MRGQVTLFVVLGLIVLIILGFTLFVKDFIFNSQVSNAADLAFKEFEQSTSLNNYVQSCIRTVTRNGLLLLGYQGGYIYEDQGGTQPRPNFLMSNYRNNPRGVETEYFTDYWIYADDFGDGIISMPKLCSLTGPNKLGASGLSVNTCEFLALYGPEGNNAQDSLASYIDVELENCLDLDIFKDTRGNEISAESPESIVIFNENTFTVSVKYPFTIKIKGQKPELKQVNFTYEEPTRLLSMYKLLFYEVSSEYLNMTYNITENYLSSDFYKQGFVLTAIPDYAFQEYPSVCEGSCNDDLFWLKDENTEINGEPYLFMFAIADRYAVNVSGIMLDPDDTDS